MAAVLEAAAAAGRRLEVGQEAVTLNQVRMDRAIELPEQAAVALEWVFDPDDKGGYRFRLFGRGQRPDWELHAEGAVIHTGQMPEMSETFQQLRARCPREIDVVAFYDGFVRTGLDFGPSFKSVLQAWVGQGEAVGVLQADLLDRSGFDISPLLIDGALQLIAAAVSTGSENDPERLFLPIGVDRVVMAKAAAARWWGHVVLREPLTQERRALSCDVRLVGDDGRIAALLSGCRLLAVDKAALASRKAAVDHLRYNIRWCARPVSAAISSTSAATTVWRPDLPAAAAKIRQMLEGVADRHRLGEYDRELRYIDARVRIHILEALKRLGWRPDVQRAVDADELVKQLKVPERNRQLLRRFLDILTEDGVLLRQGDGWRGATDKPPSVPEPADAAEGTCLAAIESDLVDRCGSHLAEVLRGDVDVLDLMYQGDGFDSVVRLYTESVTAHVFNDLVETAVRNVMRGRPAQHRPTCFGDRRRDRRYDPCRAQWIGWHSGGLPVTDISPAFVHAAVERFGGRHGFTAQPLDIEKAPGDQRLYGRQFDLVIAANVLHATSDLTETLAHIKEITAPGGVVLLLEVTVPQRWIDITFGLTSGWWRFTDTGLRNDYPLVSAQCWMRLLEEQGFIDAVAVPAPESGAIAASLGRESILIARRPEAASTTGDQAQKRLDWLVLADAGGIGEKVDQRIDAMGMSHAIVRGDGDRNGVHRPNGDLERLLAVDDNGKQRTGRCRYPARILYLGALDDGPGSDDEATDDDLEADRVQGDVPARTGAAAGQYSSRSTHSIDGGHPRRPGRGRPRPDRSGRHHAVGHAAGSDARASGAALQGDRYRCRCDV